ncbi:MAG: hypothetical protein ACRD0U_12685 [Acidimicrobiales bacterium]
MADLVERRTRGNSGPDEPAIASSFGAPSTEEGDHGAGLIGTIAGVTVFLAFLLFAVQLLVNLYAASAVTSVGFDAVRRVASAPDRGELARIEAEARIRQSLGRAYGDIQLDWDLSDPDVVRLRVRAENPNFLPAGLDGPLPFDAVDRDFTVRVEEFR